MLKHPYYFSFPVITSGFKIPSRVSFTEHLLKSFLIIYFISGLVEEKAAK